MTTQRPVERPPDPPTRAKRRRGQRLPRPTPPPEDGWHLGARGVTRASWATLACLLVALGALLLAVGYVGYGAMILILAAAAVVNLL